MRTEEQPMPSTRVARGATAVFLKSIAGAPLGLIYIAILTRLIPPKEMGILAILGFFTSLLSVIGDLGLSGASSKFIPELLGRGEASKALGVYRKILALSMASAGTILVVLLPLSTYLSSFLTHSNEYILVMVLAIASIPIAIVFNILLSFIQSFQRMKEYATLSFIQLNAGRFLGLALLALGLGLAGVFYGSIAAGLLATVLIALILKRRLNSRDINLSDPLSDFPATRLLGFSLPLLGVGLLGVLLGWIDSVFIWTKLPLSDLGIYQIATATYGFLLILPQALSTSLYPQLTELYGRRGKSSLSEAFRTASRYLSFIYIPSLFAAISFSEQIIATLTGPRYSEATLPFAIMASGAFPAGFTMILNLNFMALGKTKQFFGLQALSLSAYLLVLPLLVPKMGIEGAAVSRTAVALVTMLVTLFILKRYMPVHFDSEGCLKSTASSLIASAMVLPLTRLSSTLILFPFHLLLFAMLYLFALIALKALHDHDLTRMETFLPSKVRFIASFLRRLAS